MTIVERAVKNGAIKIALAAMLAGYVLFGGAAGYAQQSGKPDYYTPQWSPDAKKITFSTYQDKKWDLYIVNADGTSLRRLIDDPAGGNGAAWSHDGKKIAFARKTGDNTDIYVMNADGSHPMQLTSNAGKLNGGPAWSPDGKKIAFFSNRDGRRAQIYVMDASGRNQTRLTDNSGANFGPEWSPDGKRIIFESSRDNGDIDEIYIMNGDGSDQTRITHRTEEGFNNIYPMWMPKGRRPNGLKIGFASFGKDKVTHVYQADLDGSHPTVLIENASYARWSPNGSKVVFIQRVAGSGEIFVMNKDGSQRLQLTK